MLILETDKGIFEIRKGFLMTEPIKKKYHINDKVDDIPKGIIGLKRACSEPCALHQQKLMAMWIDPCEADGYISMPSWRMTLTEGEAYRRVLCGLMWSTRMFLYGNILHTMHKDPTTWLSPYQNGGYPQDLGGINSTSSL